MMQSDESGTVLPGALQRRAAHQRWQRVAWALRHSWVGLLVLLYLLGLAHGEPAALAVVGVLVTLTLLAVGATLVLAWSHARRSAIERPWMPWAVFCYSPLRAGPGGATPRRHSLRVPPPPRRSSSSDNGAMPGTR